MEIEQHVRIDKYLWAVRLFKTRSQATEACKSGRIIINGLPVKSSRTINKGEIFIYRSNPVTYTYKIKEILHNRVGAKLVENYLENLTPQEELLKLDMDHFMPFVRRDRGAGRPTKKERREIDKFKM